MKKLSFLALVVLCVSLPGCLKTNAISGQIGVVPESATVAAGTTQQFEAVHTGSLQASSVDWSIVGSGCTASSCGTIDSNGTFTAPATPPAGNVIHVVATVRVDKSQSGFAVVTLGQAVKLTVQLSGSTTVQASGNLQFTPTVSNTSNDLVNWAISGTTGSGAQQANCTIATCGSLNHSQTGTVPGFSSTTYTAPATLPPTPAAITVTGTSAADPTKTFSANITLVSSVTTNPNGSPTANVNQTVPFTATVTGPPPAQQAVNWSLTDSNGVACTAATCGSLTNVTANAADYVAPGVVPNPATAILTATAQFDGQKSAPVTITIAPLNSVGPNNRLQGRYAFTYRSYPNVTGTPVVEAGSLVFDGAGSVSGIEDDNDGATPHVQQPVSGSYSVQADGRGSISLGSGPAKNIKIVVLSTSDATVATTAYLNGGATPGAGRMELQQNPSSLSLSSLNNPFAVSLRGAAMPAAVGRFDLDGAGGVKNIEIGKIYASSTFDTAGCSGAGPVISPSSSYTNSNGSYATNAATTTAGNFSFAMPAAQIGNSTNQSLTFSAYVVSSGKLFLIETDSSGFVFVGSAEQQTSTSFSNSVFPGLTVYHFQSNNGPGAGNITQGPADSAGTGFFGEIEYFGNIDGVITPSTFFQDAFGSYAVQTSSTNLSAGAGAATFCSASQSTTETAATAQIAFYMVSATKSFAWDMAADPSGSATIADAIGEIDPQQGGPYAALSSLTGTFAFVFEGVDGTFNGAHTPSAAVSESGVVTFDGAGNATFTFDVVEGASVSTGVTVTATYLFGGDNDGDGQDADGYGVLTPTGTLPTFTFPEHFVVVSGNKIFFMHQGTDSNVGGVAETQ